MLMNVDLLDLYSYTEYFIRLAVYIDDCLFEKCSNPINAYDCVRMAYFVSGLHYTTCSNNWLHGRVKDFLLLDSLAIEHNN